MSLSDRISAEDQAAHALIQSKREAARAAARADAFNIVAEALRACPSEHRPALSVALLQAAAEAVAQTHDGARAQAVIGAAARRHGSELSAPRADVRRAAERAFNARQVRRGS